MATEISTSENLNDRIADAYYDTTARRSHTASTEYYEDNARRLKRRFGSWLPARTEARCLDLACGCGEFLYLLENLGFANIVGVDLCEEELNQAYGYVKAELYKTEVLEFLSQAPAASFDFISALNFLEHIPKDNLLKVLKECRRVLRPGGVLVAMVPNAVSPFGSLTRHWDITHEWAFTTNNFRQLAALVRFDQQVEFRECGPHVHGILSAIRYALWQLIRAGVAAWFLIELGTTKDRVYTMDMLVRMRAIK